MDIFRVAFFGHRYIDNPMLIQDILCEQIQEILTQREYVEFLVGRSGEFDLCSGSAVHRIKENFRDDNSSLILVLPYPTMEYINNQKAFEEYYDEIEISQRAANAYYKSAIQIRNREIVDRADLIICYIEHSFGGAYKTVEYAKKHNTAVYNIYKSL